MRSLAYLALTLSATAACTTSTDSMLTIHNSSSYSMVEINLSPVSMSTWGDNLLGAQRLDPGDELSLSNIPCDTYDIRLVDGANAMCVLPSVNLCLDNELWRLDDATLAACSF